MDFHNHFRRVQVHLALRSQLDHARCFTEQPKPAQIIACLINVATCVPSARPEWKESWRERELRRAHPAVVSSGNYLWRHSFL